VAWRKNTSYSGEWTVLFGSPRVVGEGQFEVMGELGALGGQVARSRAGQFGGGNGLHFVK
jgi:hypothetical protein